MDGSGPDHRLAGRSHSESSQAAGGVRPRVNSRGFRLLRRNRAPHFALMRRHQTTLGIGILLLLGILVAGAKDKPTKVFLLAGQSNMEGQGVVSMDDPRDYNGGKGNLVWSMENSASEERMKHLKDAEGNWTVRDDVQISFKVNGKVRKGGLTVGYTGYGGSSHIGPELQFGHVMGDYFEEPVLLIKTAWGGKSLYVDFRPPSSGGQVGPYYTQMIEEVRAALAELGDRKYEIADLSGSRAGTTCISERSRSRNTPRTWSTCPRISARNSTCRTCPWSSANWATAAPRPRAAWWRSVSRRAGHETNPQCLICRNPSFARPPEMSPNPGHGHDWFGNAESYFLVGATPSAQA